MNKYQVEVYTGNRAKAGTNANIYMNITGKDGSSGKRALKKSLNNMDKFEQGNMDTFEIEAADMGELTKVVVGHDGKGAGENSGLNIDLVIDRSMY